MFSSGSSIAWYVIVGNYEVRYSPCCLCNLSVTSDYGEDGNTDVAASTEVVPVMVLAGAIIHGDVSV